MDSTTPNIASACTSLQCERGLAAKVAMRWIDAQGRRRDYTFRMLDTESNRFANLLASLGIAKGEVLFTFLPKMPEQFFALRKEQRSCGGFCGGFDRRCFGARVSRNQT